MTAAINHKTTMLLVAGEETSVGAICEILDSSGIGYKLDEDSAIYVAGMIFNFWVWYDEHNSSIVFSTYCDLSPEIEKDAALRFVNGLNYNSLLVQLSYYEARNRLGGHCWISCKAGVTGADLIRTSLRFAATFAQAVDAVKESGHFTDGSLASAYVN